MKKIILTFALITGLYNISNSQTVTAEPSAKKQQKANQTPEEAAKHDANSAEKKLGLNAQQKTDWEAAALKRIIANRPIHDKFQVTTAKEERKSLHAQAKVNNDAFEATVNSFLTPDQKTKFEQLKEQRKQERKAKAAKGKDEIEG